MNMFLCLMWQRTFAIFTQLKSFSPEDKPQKRKRKEARRKCKLNVFIMRLWLKGKKGETVVCRP